MTLTPAERCCCRTSSYSFVSRSALYCAFVFILTQALLQPMCLGLGIADVPDEAVSSVSSASESEAVSFEFVDWVYGNIMCVDSDKAVEMSGRQL